METFGEYEAVEELASTSVSTVYRARKAGGPARFAIKLRHIRQHLPSGDTELTPHPGGQPRELGEADELKFLEAAKLQRRAAEAGGSHIAHVRGFAIDERGAWAVTDHFPRGSIRNWINLQQRVNAAELAWLVHCIVQGLLADRKSVV